MKTIEFPNLTHKQVALIRAEKNTGIVLDENYKRHISDLQVFYSLFDTYEEAKQYIVDASKEDVEYVIYGKNKEVLFLYP